MKPHPVRPRLPTLLAFMFSPRSKFAVLCGLVFYSPPVLAAPGDVDLTFGTGGGVTTTIPGSTFSKIEVLAVQNDDKILAGGNVSMANQDFAILRYLPDGAADESFGTGGRVIVNVGSDELTDIKVQSDGRILAAGVTYADSTRTTCVIRLLPDGALDDSFGTGGVLRLDPSFLSMWNARLFVQADGKIVVARYVLGNISTEAIISRLSPNGSPDLSFNGTGRLHIPGGEVWTLKVMADGHILVGGWTGGYKFWMARCSPTGALDLSFGGTGTVMTDFGANQYGQLWDLEVQEDGGILAVGRVLAGATTRCAVARYQANGTPDLSFHGTGRVIGDPIPGSSYLVRLHGNHILVAGKYALHQVCARYDLEGRADPAFNGSGLCSVVPGYQGTGNALAVQSGGRIITGGLMQQTFALTGHVTVNEGPDIGVRAPVTGERRNGDGIQHGNAHQGGEVITTYTLKNRGVAPLVVSAVVIEGTDASLFTLVANPPAVLTPGEEADLAVKFAGSDTPGDFRATLHINSSDADENPFLLTLYVTVYKVRISILRPDGQDASTSENTWSGALPDVPISVTYTLRNDDSVPKTVTAIGPNPPSPYFSVQWPQPVTLPPGGRAPFTVTHRGSGLIRGATIAVTAHDAQGDSGNTFSITVHEASWSEQWRYRYFGTTAATGMAADLSDSDNDGIPNLLEYGTFTDPTNPNKPPGTLVKNGGVLEFTVEELPWGMMTPHGVDYIVEQAESLDGPWLETVIGYDIVSDDAQRTIVRYRLPATTKTSFVRLRVKRI
jgi:uncharacterized delta-60 repeat protein